MMRARLRLTVFQIVHAQRQRHAGALPKALINTGRAAAFDVLKQQGLVVVRRAFADAIGDLGDFQFGIDLGCDADQLAALSSRWMNSRRSRKAMLVLSSTQQTRPQTIGRVRFVKAVSNVPHHSTCCNTYQLCAARAGPHTSPARTKSTAS